MEQVEPFAYRSLDLSFHEIRLVVLQPRTSPQRNGSLIPEVKIF